MSVGEEKKPDLPPLRIKLSPKHHTDFLLEMRKKEFIRARNNRKSPSYFINNITIRTHLGSLLKNHRLTFQLSACTP